MKQFQCLCLEPHGLMKCMGFSNRLQQDPLSRDSGGLERPAGSRRGDSDDLQATPAGSRRTQVCILLQLRLPLQLYYWTLEVYVAAQEHTVLMLLLWKPYLPLHEKAKPASR